MIFKLHCEKHGFSNILSTSESELIAKFANHQMFKIRPGQKIEMPLVMFKELFSSMYKQMVFEATQYDAFAFTGKLAVHQAIVKLLEFVEAIDYSKIMPADFLVWECDQ